MLELIQAILADPNGVATLLVIALTGTAMCSWGGLTVVSLLRERIDHQRKRELKELEFRHREAMAKQLEGSMSLMLTDGVLSQEQRDKVINDAFIELGLLPEAGKSKKKKRQ